MTKLYQDTVGAQIVINLGESLSGGTVFQMNVRKPSGTEDTWTASATESTKITYTTVDGDLDECVGDSCLYEITPYVELASWEGDGETVFLKIWKRYH